MLFSFTIYLEYDFARLNGYDDVENDLFYLWMYSMIFLIFPYIMQCAVCIIKTTKWNRMKKNNPIRMHEYLKNYFLVIYGLTIISGFYGSIALLRSKWFYFEMFWIPLREKELNSLKSLRFMNVVVFETIPQFIGQLWYVLIVAPKSDVSENISSIVFISMTFSVLGIIYSLMYELSVICESCKPRASKFNNMITISTDFSIESPELTLIQSFVYDKIDLCFKSTIEQCRVSKTVDWLQNTSKMSVDIETYYIVNQIESLKSITAYSEISIFYDNDSINWFENNDDKKNNTKIDDKHLQLLFANRVKESIENFGILTTIENEKFVSSIMNVFKLKDESQFQVQGFGNIYITDKDENKIIDSSDNNNDDTSTGVGFEAFGKDYRQGWSGELPAIGDVEIVHNECTQIVFIQIAAHRKCKHKFQHKWQEVLLFMVFTDLELYGRTFLKISVHNFIWVPFGFMHAYVNFSLVYEVFVLLFFCDLRYLLLGCFVFCFLLIARGVSFLAELAR